MYKTYSTLDHKDVLEVFWLMRRKITHSVGRISEIVAQR